MGSGHRHRPCQSCHFPLAKRATNLLGKRHCFCVRLCGCTCLALQALGGLGGETPAPTADSSTAEVVVHAAMAAPLRDGAWRNALHKLVAVLTSLALISTSLIFALSTSLLPLRLPTVVRAACATAMRHVGAVVTEKGTSCLGKNKDAASVLSLTPLTAMPGWFCRG